MNRFIKLKGNCCINLDALREITWREDGDIEIRYSSSEWEVLHFDSMAESRKLFNDIMLKLEISDSTFTPKCFKKPIDDLCEGTPSLIGTRIKGACIRNNIKTIGDLVNFGKTKFKNQRNIGNMCVDIITTYLRDTYGYIWHE